MLCYKASKVFLDCFGDFQGDWYWPNNEHFPAFAWKIQPVKFLWTLHHRCVITIQYNYE